MGILKKHSEYTGIDLFVLRRVEKGSVVSFCTWEPFFPMVILGRGSQEKEIYKEKCLQDNIPILRRRTGGGSVLLSQGMLIISLAQRVKPNLHIKKYTDMWLKTLLHFLKLQGIQNVSCKGISDICIGNKKIAGTGLYIKRNILLCQTSILVENDLSLIEKYIKHPPREPDYRKHRPHHSFLTNLHKEGYHIPTKSLKQNMFEYLKQYSKNTTPRGKTPF